MSHSANYRLPDNLPIQDHTHILPMGDDSPSVELTSIKDRVYVTESTLLVQTQGAITLSLLHSDDGRVFECCKSWDSDTNIKATAPDDTKRFIRWQVERKNPHIVGVYDVSKAVLFTDRDWWFE